MTKKQLETQVTILKKHIDKIEDERDLYKLKFLYYRFDSEALNREKKFLRNILTKLRKNLNSDDEEKFPQ